MLLELDNEPVIKQKLQSKLLEIKDYFKKNKIDTVCFMENCKVQNGQLNFIKKPLRGENIRCQGEDLRVNQVVMEKGRKIRAVDIAQLSSINV